MGLQPWERAIAVLGEGAWKLIIVQHANSAGDIGHRGKVDHGNAVAYFKRPKVEGPRVVEPELRLP